MNYNKELKEWFMWVVKGLPNEEKCIDTINQYNGNDYFELQNLIKDIINER